MYSFPRAARLVHQSDFQSVYANHPSKSSNRSFLALYRPNQLGRPRLGMSIRKHLIPSSVDRNTIRRIMRESFRHCQHRLMSFDIVLLLRSRCDVEDKKTLREDIDRLWERLVTVSML